MPIYEYECKQCSKAFEEIVFKDDEVVECPQCKSKDTAKLISRCRHTSAHGGSIGHESHSSSSGGCSGCSSGSCSSCG